MILIFQIGSIGPPQDNNGQFIILGTSTSFVTRLQVWRHVKLAGQARIFGKAHLVSIEIDVDGGFGALQQETILGSIRGGPIGWQLNGATIDTRRIVAYGDHGWLAGKGIFVVCVDWLVVSLSCPIGRYDDGFPL